jgi:uncharacterized protein
MPFVIGAFFLTALLYSSVGFGGGSTYNAILIFSGVDYQIVPVLSLCCNIIVVAGGIWHFHRHNHLSFIRALPWIFFSVPAAFIGGAINVSETFFIGLLGSALLFSGLRLLWPETAPAAEEVVNRQESRYQKILPSTLGSVLGFVAGLTGIGGGIFLAPVLYFIKWGNPKQIAATCALFIFVNSCAGILGQLLKLDQSGLILMVQPYWMLFPAVLLGGQVGAALSASRLKLVFIKRATAVLILYVALRLLTKFFYLI